VVADGATVLSNVVASQVEVHKPFYGVVPEIASRKHVEWISGVVIASLQEAGASFGEIDVVAATFRPGLIGSLLVGLSYAKGLALALGRPFIGVDHIQAHLYAPNLEEQITYPHIGMLVSGGHTLVAFVEDFDRFRVMGTTIDDACGEAFDKVAKFHDFGYPGGVAIERLAEKGDPRAFRFPTPSLHKGDHRYDVSYSGLKTAAAMQLDLFWNKAFEKSPENIAAAFQKAAIDMIAEKAIKACKDTGLDVLVAGGGVSANQYLRSCLAAEDKVQAIFPPLSLCTDNGAMVAGLAYRLHSAGKASPLDLKAQSRLPSLRRGYP
jgi:N6-L-threonylcarbamoyladenine synthase